MDFNQKKQDMEANFAEAMEAAKNLNEHLLKLRQTLINIDPKTLEDEDRKHLLALGQEVDNRAAFVLRALLIQHGNLLFL